MFRQLAPRGGERGRPVPIEGLSNGTLASSVTYLPLKSDLIWAGYASS